MFLTCTITCFNHQCVIRRYQVQKVSNLTRRHFGLVPEDNEPLVCVKTFELHALQANGFLLFVPTPFNIDHNSIQIWTKALVVTHMFLQALSPNFLSFLNPHLPFKTVNTMKLSLSYCIILYHWFRYYKWRPSWVPPMQSNLLPYTRTVWTSHGLGKKKLAG